MNRKWRRKGERGGGERETGEREVCECKKYIDRQKEKERDYKRLGEGRESVSENAKDIMIERERKQ